MAQKDVKEEDIVTPLKDVIRKATEEDEKIVEKNRQDAQEAEEIAIEKIQNHKLEMKLVDVEYTFDRVNSYSISPLMAELTLGN